MTKYARTKDGKIVKVNLEGNVFTSRYEIIGEPKDTIEELCDAFVYKKRVMNDLKELLLYKKFIGGNKGPIYGAIWTDKGLIYATKMNSEGVLELI